MRLHRFFCWSLSFCLLLTMLSGCVITEFLHPDFSTEPEETGNAPETTEDSWDFPSFTFPWEVTLPEETAPPTTVPTEPYVVATASVGVTGDILPHKPVINAAGSSDANYDFSPMFAKAEACFNSYDYMIANMEVPLGGTEAGPYQGYPKFNSPDAVAKGLQGAGVDMLLTATNHSYDTGLASMKRTIRVIGDMGMDHLGTRSSTEEPFYIVKDLNGIKVGMVCYTYETGSPYEGQIALNGLTLSLTASGLVSYFNYNELDAFYGNVSQTLEAMYAEGAEFTMVFLHWGNEYQKSPNSYQTAMAQNLCELGVDIIVGGHPHVVQPFETLTSSTGHETYCLYSTGNALSNQRRTEIPEAPKGHTEDGVIFGVEFAKWNDGSTAISDIHIIPTWVNMDYRDGKKIYEIIPLDPAMETWADYEVSLSSLRASYARTMEIIGEGLNACRAALGQAEFPLTME